MRRIGHVVEEVSFGVYRHLLCTCGWEPVGFHALARDSESDAGRWKAFARHRKTAPPQGTRVERVPVRRSAPIGNGWRQQQFNIRHLSTATHLRAALPPSVGTTRASRESFSATLCRVCGRLHEPLRHVVAARTSLSRAWSIIALTGVAVALGLFDLGSKGLWVDEGLSAAIANFDPVRVVAAAWSTPTPGAIVLYYELLHLWAQIGTSETILRLLSVLFVAGSVPVVYVLAARLVGQRAALISALVVALSPFAVRYSQEARPYALVLLLAAASSLALVGAIEGGSWRRWAAYWLLSTMGLYVHNTAAFLLAAQLVGVIILTKGPDWPPTRAVIAFAAIGLASLPLVGLFVSPATSISFVPGLSVVSVIAVGREIAGSALLLVGMASAYGIGIFVALARPRGSEGRRRLFAVALGAIPIGGELLLSVVRPIFLGRYAMIAFPGLAMGIGLGLVSLPWLWVRRTALVSLILALVIGLQTWYMSFPKEGWREAVKAISTHALPGDGVIVYPEYARLPFDYYVERDAHASASLVPVFPTPGWGVYFPAMTGGAPLATVVREANKVRRVWVVARYAFPPPDSVDGRFLGDYLSGSRTLLALSFTGVQVNLAELP